MDKPAVSDDAARRFHKAHQRKLSRAGHPLSRTALSLIREEHQLCTRRAEEEKGGPLHYFWANRRDMLEWVLLVLEHHRLGK